MIFVSNLTRYRPSFPLAEWLPSWLAGFDQSRKNDPFLEKEPNVGRLWRIADKKELLGFANVDHCLFLPDGKTLVTLHGDATLKFWDLPVTPPWGRIVGISVLVWAIGLFLFGSGLQTGRWMRQKWAAGRSQSLEHNIRLAE
ncbi:hypothetical protein BH10PLA2_BH10PLA2_03630 [soil metagenome]